MRPERLIRPRSAPYRRFQGVHRRRGPRIGSVPVVVPVQEQVGGSGLRRGRFAVRGEFQDRLAMLGVDDGAGQLHRFHDLANSLTLPTPSGRQRAGRSQMRERGVQGGDRGVLALAEAGHADEPRALARWRG